MLSQLKENIVHGTKEYPYEQYYLRNINHAFQVPVHWHEQVEIIYVEEGNLRIKIGDSEFEGTKDDLFFVNPRELHLMGSADGRVRYYTLLFPMEFISFQTMDNLEKKLLLPLRSNQLLFPKVIEDCALRQELISEVKEVIEINKNIRHFSTDEIELSEYHIETRVHLIRLLQKLYKAHVLIKASQGESEQKQKKLLAYIQEHYTEKITLETLAEEFHMSEKYVSRYFLQHFHLPFSRYIMHLRLTHAKRLLETTDDNVTDIAMQSGFYNVSYFIRSFKKAYGIAPLHYRKSMR